MPCIVVFGMFLGDLGNFDLCHIYMKRNTIFQKIVICNANILGRFKL